MVTWYTGAEGAKGPADCAARRIAEVERVALKASNPAVASCTAASAETESVATPQNRADGRAAARRKAMTAAIEPAATTTSAILSQGPKATIASIGCAPPMKGGATWSYPAMTTNVIAAIAIAPGSEIFHSVRDSTISSSQPMTSASGANIGRMYDGSFDPDALKNRKTKATHTSANRCHEKPSGFALPARHARRVP